MSKDHRVLWIYKMLLDGKHLTKAELVEKYGITEKSIQRDMECVSAFLESEGTATLIYDKRTKEYYLEKFGQEKLQIQEMLPILKTIFESGAILPQKLFPILEKMVALMADNKDRQELEQFLLQEETCYQPPIYKKPIGIILCQVEKIIKEHQWVKLCYCRTENSEEIECVVLPQTVVMREKRFFLVAQTDIGIEYNAVALYRIDRINKIEPLHEAQFYQIQKQKEVREKVVSVAGGEEYHIRFLYHANSIITVKEKLPHAKFVPIKDGWQVDAFVYGKGIGSWLRSLGKRVSNIEIERSN